MLTTFISAFRSLPTLAATRPQRIFWGFAALHFMLWTILSAWSSPNAPLDVIEGYAWGREWLWGTYKHPPMQAWCLEVIAALTGRAAWAPFFVSQVAVIVAFWAVWRTGQRIMGASQALIGVLLLEGVIYYNLTSTEFNPNVLQLAFWALAGWSFHRAVKGNRLFDWLLLGLWGAGGLYSKYSTVLLLGVFVFLVVARPEARRCLKKPGPYLALLLTALLFLPHLVWLWQHDFLPFAYIRERLEVAGPATRYVTPPAFFPPLLLSPLVFLVAQILALLPATLLFLVLDDRPEASREVIKVDKFDRTFLAAITFVPMTLTLAMSIVLGFKIHDMWGAPFFNFAGLWALAVFYPLGARLRMRFFCAWAIIFLAALLGHAGGNFLTPYVGNKPLRVHFPGAELSRQVTAVWHRRYAEPLTYVIGNTWLAGNIAYYAPERPQVYIDGDPVISPWVDANDLKRRGGILVWNEIHKTHRGEDRENALRRAFPQAEIQKPLEIPQQTGADLLPALIGWAIVPPQPGG